MKSKTIYLLRHGQTDLNKSGRVQGRGVDSSLNDTGRSQAQKVAQAFENIPLELVYTSLLKRTHETIQPFVHRGIVRKSHAGFDEISWGNQEGKEATTEAKSLYQQTVNGWRAGNLTLNVGGGESPLEVMERQKHAMDELISQGANNMLVCMHGRAMRILLCWLLNYPLNYMDGFPHDNCAYYKLKLQKDVFSIIEFNQTSHLK